MPSVRRLASFLRPYWLWAALAPALMVLEVAMDLMQPRLVQHIVDAGIARHDLALVRHTAAWMVACALVGIVGGAGCTVFSVLAAQGFGTDLRQASFGKVQTLSFGNLDELETGGLITRLTNDIVQVQELVMMLLRIMVRVPLLLVGSLAMAILTSPTLALLFLPLVPLVLGVLVWIVRRTFPLFGVVQHRLDGVNTVVQENLSGARVVKAFAREDHECARFTDASDLLVAGNLAAARVSVLTMPAMMLALNGGVVATLWLGGVHVAAGHLHVGQIIAFVNYLMQTLMSVMMVSMLIVRMSRAEASARRIGEVLDSEPLVKQPAQVARLPQPGGRVAFEHVTFRYHTGDDTPVLRDISFTAEPGQTVAILGATGSGKSSLVNLIPRFYDVSEGRVTLDGVDVRDIDEDDLRAAVAIAPQESVLFSGTIRDAIRYGRPAAAEEEVVAAARAARADEFVAQMPEGYDTVIGQRGVNLSGGQRQRLALARALAARPAVLILDDTTSAVDVETEAAIQEGLATSAAACTRIVVAQRVTAAANADLILVLDDGTLAACGTHADLLERSPIYAEIYASQTVGGGAADGTR